MRRLTELLLLAFAALLFPATCPAQLDPFKRQLIELGFNQPLSGRGPVAGYAYYYFNQPGFTRTNLTLRLAIAPVYLDGELGFRGLLGERTDFALGVSGGGFADSFSEIRGGHFFKEESFTGHGGGLSASVYHLFNPGQLIPLNGVVRVGGHQSVFSREADTAAAFTVPRDITSLNVRAGLRLGGREPLMAPDAAMEISLWYEGQFRKESMAYGYASDRFLHAQSHLIWGRALLAYTLPESRHSFSVGLTTGISLDADRFSSYRLGAALPLNAEFPLNLPGYYYQEITARRFALVGGLYSIPLDSADQWSLTGFASSAVVDYVPGLDQPGNWHSGIGGGLGWHSRDNVWQVILGYAYGVDAIRNDHRGAHSIGLLIQLDLEARAHAPKRPIEPGVGPEKSRFLERLFRR